MGCRAVALLLLTLAAAVTQPSSLSAAEGREDRTGSSTGTISIQGTDVVFFTSPTKDKEEHPTLTKSITSTPTSTGAPLRKSAFTTEAYPVRWSDEGDHDPPRDVVSANENSFTPEAYPVTWSDKGDHNPPHDVVSAYRNSFTPEAYPVRWSGKGDHIPPHDVVSAHRNSMPQAYPVTWNDEGDHNPPHDGFSAQRSSFTPEAYPVTWSGKGDHNPPHDGVSAHRNSFMPEAYPVRWNGKGDHNPPPPHDDVSAHRNSFMPKAYPVRWNSKVDHNPPHDGFTAQRSSFTPEAYPVRWNGKEDHNRPHHVVAAQQSSFTPEAYPVRWNSKGDPNPRHAYVAEATLARGHDDLHVRTGMLFTRNSLFPGAILPEGTKFAGNGFPDPRRFAFREDADAIPFSYKQIDTILRTFGIPRVSKKADQVAATLRICEAKSPEPHTCATSKQAEVDFAASSLATSISELRAMVTVVRGKQDAARYTVAPNGVARIGKAGGAMVPCHPLAYPYMVHYCHRTADVEALRVELMGLGDEDDRAAATAATGAIAIAMCHANTTTWDARYFQMLNATRGEEICHFMPHNYVLWLPAAAL